ncbi:MAG: hypothetical protein Q9196_000926 [Gyalolechia fulgens]
MASYMVFSRGPRILGPHVPLVLPRQKVLSTLLFICYLDKLTESDSRDQERVRPFHEWEKQQWRFDTSAMDFAYMPQHTLEEVTPPEIMRSPLLPHNSSTAHTDPGLEETVNSVIRPEISTISADSTHIESPSAMSEVTDNHAIDLDPYDLTNKVTAAATRTAEDAMDKIKEAGTVRQLWSGLLDDMFGSKRLSKA